MEEVHNDNENKTIEDFLTEDDVVVEFPKKKKRKKSKRKKEYDDRDDNKTKKRVIIVISIIVGIILLALLLGLVLVPKIKLVGDKYVEIEYGETYEDLGCTASFLGSDISDKIWYEGVVDTEKLGRYNITCKVRKNRFTVEKTRKIKVVDTKTPEIILTGEKESVVCPNKDYVEEGFTASDNYDGDITDKVKVTNNEDKVVYEVSDSSDNKFSIERTLIREDKESPKITLKGSKTTYVTVGNKYNEAGFSASDNCDGDITSDVKVEGSVDTSKTGTYTVSYIVTDSTGNKSVEDRKVIVQNTYSKPSSSSGCGEAGVIYLTFDDGPNSNYTPTILNVLKKYNVKATFFVTSAGPDSLIKREYDEGHAIGLHSSSHDYAKIYKSSEAFWADMNVVASRVKRITGVDSKLIRFPGGASNTVSRKYNSGIMSRLANEVLEKGYNYYDWNISSGDAGGTTDPNVEYKNVVNSLSKSRGNVILMHDIKKHTMNAIENIVKYGLDNGYQFKVLSSSVNCKQKVNN